MRRGYFTATVIIAAALVLASGVLLFHYLPRLIPENTGQEMLEEWVEENTNAELKTGYIAPLFLPGIGIQIRDLDLKLRDQDGNSKDFFTAKAVKVTADFKELWKNKNLAWREVIVEEPELHLALEPSCQWNAASWAKHMPIREKKEKQPRGEQGLIEWMIKDVLKDAMPDTATGISDLLQMKRVSIRNAKVRAVDQCDSKRALKAPLDLSDVNFDFRGAYGENPARFTISVPVPQEPGRKNGPLLKFKGTLEAPSDEEIEITSFSGGWSGIAIHSLTGTLQLKPKFKFDTSLDATASFESIHRIGTWKPVSYSRTLPDMRGQGSGRVKLHLWGPDLTRRFKVHYQGRADIDGMTWDPGRVIAPLEELRTTIYLEDGELRMPPTQVRLADTVVLGSARIVEAKLPRFILDTKADYMDFDKLFRPRRTPYVKGRPMLTMRTLWGGRADIKEGVYGKMRLLNAKGVWDVTNKRLLTFPELEFNSCGGTYTESGRSWVDFNDPTDYRFRFDGRIRGMDMAAFADQVFDTTTFLNGKADADGHVTGTFVSGEFMTRSLGGNLAITFSDGYFEGFNLFGSIMDFFRLEVPEDFRGQKFRIMSATVRFDKGVAYTEDLKVESLGLKAEAKGWIDFASQHADLKIKINFLRPVTGIMGELPLVGVVTKPAGEAVTTLYVRAYGHWDYLNYAAWNPINSEPPEPPKIKDAPG